MGKFAEDVRENLKYAGCADPSQAPLEMLYSAVAKASLERVRTPWASPAVGKTACYFCFS